LEERSAGFLFFILLFYDPWWVSWGKRRAGILKNETQILFFKTAPLQTKSYGEERASNYTNKIPPLYTRRGSTRN